MKLAAVTVSSEEVPIEDLPVVANPSKAADLRVLFTVVPEYDRPRMAVAFLNLTIPQWGALAGFGSANMFRWLTSREHRLPFGVAARLAHVFGVPMEELFRDWM